MRLIECYVENFGKISDKKFIFDRGFNPIKEDNGGGKTTLAAFIKVMLFGMGESKKTSVAENDRRHYLPWNGGRCGGSLTLEKGGRIYRIEREFGRKPSQDSFALYDVERGRSCTDFSERIGEEIFGIDGDGFERSVYFSERGLLPEDGAEGLMPKLTDTAGSEDGARELEGALAILDRQRRRYTKKGGGGEIADAEARIAELERRIDGIADIEKQQADAREELARLATRIAETRDERDALIKRRAKDALSAGASHEVRFAALKEEIAENEREIGRLMEFFGGRLPTHGELDDAAAKAAEGVRLCEAARAEGGPEYRGLAEFFDGRTGDDEIGRVEAAIARQDGRATRDDGRKREAAQLLCELQKSRQGGKRRGSLPKLLCGLAIILLSLGTGYFINALFYALAVVGLPLMLVGIFGSSGRKKAGNAADVWGRVKKFLDSDGISEVDAEELLGRIASGESAAEDVGDMRTIYDFLGKFPLSNAPDAIAMARGIIADYRRMTRLSGEAARAASEMRTEGERMLGEVADFLTRFRTVSQDKIPEIRRALAKYEYISSAISEKNRTLADFASLHGIRTREDDAPDELVRAADVKLSALEREYAVTEERYKSLGRRIEERGELLPMLEVQKERHGRLVHELFVLQTTARLLGEAREGMASRYLGGIRESLEKYRRELADLGREAATVDTGLGLAIEDGGATRPIDAYSRGRRDFHRILMRLALIDTLYGEDAPPLILDDPFTALDDGRVDRALLLLLRLAEKRQIIYLTCSEARMPRR